MITGIFIVPSYIKFTMENLTKKLNSYKRTLISLTAIFIICAMLLYSEAVKSAAYEALANCLNIIIPCIFPMMALTFFLLETGFSVKIIRFTEKFLFRCFGLSGNCLEAIILGITGGYNTAVKSAVKLKNEKRITEEYAKRTALFFTNPGISFTVLLTGASLSGSISNGLRIYIFNILFNFITAFLYNTFNKHTEHLPISTENKGIADALISAVESASSAIISISFNIIFFACMTCILDNILPFQLLKSFLRLIGEVSSAVLYSSSHYPFYVTAGVLTFGGLCIFIQNLKDLRRLGISPSAYLTVRTIQALLVGSAEYIYSLFCPETVYSAAFYPVKITASGNSAGTLALIFLCAVYLLSVRNIKRQRFRQRKCRNYKNRTCP